jgi:hypothetical protein
MIRQMAAIENVIVLACLLAAVVNQCHFYAS